MNSVRPAYTGIVEGFFSRPLPPWTTSERQNTIRFISESAPCLDSYFYCPKDDRYVTSKWSEPYPPSELANLALTIRLCMQNNIKFIFGLNPDFPPSPSAGKRVIRQVLNKFDQLRQIGCTVFCLLYDDIPLSYSISDNIPGSRSDILTALSISSVVNKVYSALLRYKCSLWLCSPDYFFRSRTSFNQSLCDSLLPGIPLIWTGPAVFSDKITPASVARAAEVVSGRPMILWSNYPVNDYPRSPGTMFLGGFPEIDKKISGLLYGIFSNPMREAYLNFPFYISFNDWLEQGSNYDRRKSYSGAVTKLTRRKIKSADLLSLGSPSVLDRRPVRKVTDLEIPDRLPGRTQIIWGRLFYRQLVKTSKDISDFPINYLDPVYFTRTLSILRTRLSLINIKNIPDFSNIEKMKYKYRNRETISMSAGDRNKITGYLKNALKKESSLFEEYVSGIPERKARRLRLIRSSINEFGLIDVKI